MNETPLNERITRALAFMLRHQPEQFDLELDAYGFGDVGDVVRALNERLGEPVDEDDLERAVASGDRQRYEIEDGRIRALYGHSIPVEPGESTKPPETLYVAIPARDADRATRFGLRGGRRRFLHLALTEEDARESGRRADPEYTVIAIRAIPAWEEGINFYDRKSLWLAEEVPTHLLEVGTTYDDGMERRAPRERSGRDGGRGRGRGDGRDRRPRGRGRERDRDSGGEEREPAGAGEESRGESRGRSERPRRERPDRSERAPRSEPRERQEREPAAERPATRPSEPVERKRVERKPARRPSTSAPATGFGAGLDSAKPAAPRKRMEPKPAPTPAPERQPAASAPPKPNPAGGGFGAGL